MHRSQHLQAKMDHLACQHGCRCRAIASRVVGAPSDLQDGNPAIRGQRSTTRLQKQQGCTSSLCSGLLLQVLVCIRLRPVLHHQNQDLAHRPTVEAQPQSAEDQSLQHQRPPTSLMSCAPAFSTGSGRSMARAMDTPSLMTCGTPNFCSSTTLRPASGPEGRCWGRQHLKRLQLCILAGLGQCVDPHPEAIVCPI
jgi:hypothetical protein